MRSSISNPFDSSRDRRVDRVLRAAVRERVLGADVDEALRAARREAGDRHRLDERERVALHQHAVLERARLRLVGVADDVVRLRRLARDGLPLVPVGNAAPPRPSSRDSVTSRDHRRPARARARARSASKPPAATYASSDSGSTPSAMRRRSRSAGSPACGSGGRLGGELLLDRLPRRRSCGTTPARARRGRGTGSDARLGPTVAPFSAHERSVHDVRHVGGPLLEREQRVEARDAVRLGGRDREPPRRVAERALAHPADAALRGAQRGQEQVPARAVGARGAVPFASTGAPSTASIASRSASLGSARRAAAGQAIELPPGSRSP